MAGPTVASEPAMPCWASHSLHRKVGHHHWVSFQLGSRVMLAALPFVKTTLNPTRFVVSNCVRVQKFMSILLLSGCILSYQITCCGSEPSGHRLGSAITADA